MASPVMNMIPTVPVRYRPAALSAEHAALARSLARRRSMRHTQGFDLYIVAPPDDIADPVPFDMTLGSHAGRITLSRRLLHYLLGLLDPAAPGAPPDAAALLLELALEPILAGLETRFPSLAVQVLPAGETARTEFAIGLAIRQGAIADTLRLDLDLPAARLVSTALTPLPDWRDPLPDLPVPLHLRTHSATVTLADLQAACAGDFIPADALPDGDILVVAGERIAWRAQRDGSRLTIVSPRLRPQAIGLERWMIGNEIEAGDSIELDELPVRLSFELGQVELPLAEVSVLGPGHVFDLARDETQPVDILANGRRIGRGRIITVAGSIGVQIVRIGRE
jgi:type III secretion protein Q